MRWARNWWLSYPIYHTIGLSSRRKHYYESPKDIRKVLHVLVQCILLTHVMMCLGGTYCLLKLDPRTNTRFGKDWRMSCSCIHGHKARSQKFPSFMSGKLLLTTLKATQEKNMIFAMSLGLIPALYIYNGRLPVQLNISSIKNVPTTYHLYRPGTRHIYYVLAGRHVLAGRARNR